MRNAGDACESGRIRGVEPRGFDLEPVPIEFQNEEQAAENEGAEGDSKQSDVDVAPGGGDVNSSSWRSRRGSGSRLNSSLFPGSRAGRRFSSAGGT